MDSPSSTPSINSLASSSRSSQYPPRPSSSSIRSRRRPPLTPPASTKLSRLLPVRVRWHVPSSPPANPTRQLRGTLHGNQITAHRLHLKFMISFAWDLDETTPNSSRTPPVGLAKTAGTSSPRLPRRPTPWVPTASRSFDFDLLPHMVQTLLAERFGLKFHLEDRPSSAQTLVPQPPHEEGRPPHRTGCKEGPGR